MSTIKIKEDKTGRDAAASNVVEEYTKSIMLQHTTNGVLDGEIEKDAEISRLSSKYTYHNNPVNPKRTLGILVKGLQNRLEPYSH